MNKTIYLAHPISGLSYDEVAEYYEKTQATLNCAIAGLDVLSPMTAKEYLRTEKKLRAYDYSHPISTNHHAIERDRWMVKQSSVVYVNLMHAKEVSIGCMMELAWAHDNGIYSVVSMPEDSVHRHAFVLEAADLVLDSHDAAIGYLIRLFNSTTRESDLRTRMELDNG